MKLYLSSYKFGNHTDTLKTMLPAGSHIGHINNARDWTTADPIRRQNYQNEEIEQLNGFGFNAEPLNLQHYFNKQDELAAKLNSLQGLWVSGGNTFVLRQAMHLSGFDNLFNSLADRKDFLWGGYSAGICILCDSLKYIQNVDNPNDFPYTGCTQAIYEGLNVFHYGLLPHYNSDHFESEAIGKEVQMCIHNKWLFKALRDGEVIIID